jgi:hypothetical protein
MAEQQPAALAEAEATYRELRATFEGLDEPRMRVPWLGTWGVREILVHISGWHREMLPALERLARGERAVPPGVSYDDFDAWNARFVTARDGVSLAEIVDELEASHRAFTAAAARLPAGHLDPGGRARELFDGVTTGHYREHAEQIRRWRNGG